MAAQTVSYEEIRGLFGDLDAHRAAEIAATGASLAELEEVAAHLALETDVMAASRRPLTGRALRIYEIVRAYQAQFEDEA